VDGSQAVVASYRYDPYGKTLAQSGTLAAANVMRFSSKEIMTRYLDFYYYGYRFYSPDFQRWMNQDPIGEIGFGRLKRPGSTSLLRHYRDTDISNGLNLYAFGANSPNSYIDPFGLYGNPVSGPDGPAGPSSPYEPGIPYYPDGYLYTPDTTPVTDCIGRCIAANGGDWALAGLGLSSVTVGSIPKALLGFTPLGNGPGRLWTTGFSVIQHFGGPSLRYCGRLLNPYGRIVQVAGLGYLAGLSISCSALCQNDSNSF